MHLAFPETTDYALTRQPAPAGSHPTPPARRRPTVLIVDDEEGARLSVKVMLKDDYHLLLAEDGPDALRLARENRIDVAVLDIRMTGMSGIETLERLRLLNPNLEAVMMTAFETADTMKAALRLRACDYLNKPFDVSTLRAAVAGAVERRTLAGEVRKNSEELGQLQAELQETRLDGEMARARGEIYASIIHDINSPLTVISGLIKLIDQRLAEETRLEGEDLDDLKDRLKRLTRQVTLCIEISRRYLGYLRKNSVESSQAWVNHVLGDLGELVRLHPGARQHQLVIHPLPLDAAARINGTELLQVLLNLTLNALQCTAAPHRVEIRCQLLAQPLDLGLFQDGPQDRFLERETFRNQAPLLALSVEDSGPGIAPDILPRIFEPFFSAQPGNNGTGLGLRIVHRLLKDAGGALQVHTRVGQGTVFTAYLPALVGPNPAAPLVAP
jgi:signal transduction histidine kinase